jgi:hypothetical protein
MEVVELNTVFTAEFLGGGKVREGAPAPPKRSANRHIVRTPTLTAQSNSVNKQRPKHLQLTPLFLCLMSILFLLLLLPALIPRQALTHLLNLAIANPLLFDQWMSSPGFYQRASRVMKNEYKEYI